MIHSANLDDGGLKLFREWSQSDEYLQTVGIRF